MRRGGVDQAVLLEESEHSCTRGFLLVAVVAAGCIGSTARGHGQYAGLHPHHGGGALDGLVFICFVGIVNDSGGVGHRGRKAAQHHIAQRALERFFPAAKHSGKVFLDRVVLTCTSVVGAQTAVHVGRLPEGVHRVLVLPQNVKILMEVSEGLLFILDKFRRVRLISGFGVGC